MLGTEVPYHARGVIVISQFPLTDRTLDLIKKTINFHYYKFRIGLYGLELGYIIYIMIYKVYMKYEIK